jgi:type VI protein secretion system component VasA
MLKDAFARELELLYALGIELGEAHPKLHPLLGRDADPGIAHLFEQVAFTTARLSRRIDDGLSEATHPLADALCPAFVEPVPPLALMSVTPSRSLKRPREVPAGMQLEARAAGGLVVFRTTEDVVLAPLAIDSVAIVGDARTKLRIALSSSPGVDLAAALPDALRFHCALPLAQALEFRAHLAAHTRRVLVRVQGQEDKPIEVARSIAPTVARLRAKTADPMAEAWERLTAFFLLPEAFGEVEVEGFDAVRAPAEGASEMVLEIELGAPVPRAIELDDTTLHLHVIAAECARPAMLTAHALDADAGMYALRADDGGTSIVSIARVSVLEGGVARVVSPRPLLPELDALGGKPLAYEMARAPDAVRGELEIRLCVTEGELPHMLAPSASLRVEALVYDAAKASAITGGETFSAASNAPVAATARVLGSVTRPCPPMLDGDRLWDLVTARRLDLFALSQAETLARLLALLNRPAAAGWPTALEGAETFRAIRAVEARELRTSDGGLLRDGLRVAITLDVARLGSLGTARLFGDALLSLFVAAASPHERVELEVRDARGETVHRTETMAGRRLGL